MIQVADTGVGISGQEGMQVVYPKTAANYVRFHFKSVQSTLWRPNSSTVHSVTWARFCSLSLTPRPQHSTRSNQKLNAAGQASNNSLLPVSELHITHVIQGNEQPKCQRQWFLCTCVVIMMRAIFLPVLCWTELCVLVVKSCMEGCIWVRITWQALCIKNHKIRIFGWPYLKLIFSSLIIAYLFLCVCCRLWWQVTLQSLSLDTSGSCCLSMVTGVIPDLPIWCFTTSTRMWYVAVPF